MDLRLDPRAVEDRIARSVAVVRSVILSPTGAGDEELVGEVEAGRFALRVRHWYSNGLTRIVYGTIAPSPNGARISARFETLLWVVLILRAIWCATLVAAAVALRAQFHWIPIVLPALLLAVLGCVEAFGRRLGDRDEEVIRRHLARLFAPDRIGP